MVVYLFYTNYYVLIYKMKLELTINKEETNTILVAKQYNILSSLEHKYYILKNAIQTYCDQVLSSLKVDKNNLTCAILHLLNHPIALSEEQHQM